MCVCARVYTCTCECVCVCMCVHFVTVRARMELRAREHFERVCVLFECLYTFAVCMHIVSSTFCGGLCAY